MAVSAPRFQSAWRRLRPWLRTKALIGFTGVGLVIVCGLFGPLLAPYNPQQQNLSAALMAPSWSGHLFGTDHIGRDILSRVIIGARTSLIIAVCVVLLSGIVGTALGMISGYAGGRTDFAIQKGVEVVWAFPPLLLAISVVAFLGQDLPILIAALAAQRWIPFCRLTRANTLSLKERDYVTVARSIGATHTHILLRHLLPNMLQSVLIVGTFAMATSIIAEASLSFLGLGVPPSIPTWGGMLADGRAYVSTAWWIAIFPGLAIFLTVLSINMIGDVLRDNLDPKLRRSGGSR
ncbi:ABC transporter permease [Ancylobacter terrae]|uniref:ABC transporter permease n=1 Tax=Ancylobacter sp. sgz301288 TaxID=3342077 RepID=UPI0038599949